MPKTPAQNAAIREQTRKHIIEKSLELFATKGFHATSISQIAKASGMAKGALYHYFDGKRDLFAAIIKEGMEEIGDIYAVQEGLSPRQHFEAIFERFISSMDEQRQFWKLYTSIMMQGNLLQEMMEVLQPFIEETMGGFNEMLANLGVEKSEEEILAFGSFIDGMCMHYLFIYENNYPIRKVAAVFLDSFLGKEEGESP